MSLYQALPASAPPQAVLHTLLNPSPVTSRDYTDHSGGNQSGGSRTIPARLSVLRDNRSEVSDKSTVDKAHQRFLTQQDRLHSSISASTPSNFTRSLDDSSTLGRQGLGREGDTETRLQLLDLQRKYDALLTRLDQKTMTSESLTEELRSMQDDLDKTRKSCVTLATIVHDLAHDEFESPLPSHADPDSTSVIESSADTSATAYSIQHFTKFKHKNVVGSNNSPHLIDLTIDSGSLAQPHISSTPHGLLSGTSPDVVLKATSIKTPSPEVQVTSAKSAIGSKSLTPVFHACTNEVTRATQDTSMSRTSLRNNRLLPSPNTSIPSSIGSSRASSRKSSGKKRPRRSSARMRQRQIANNQLYITHHKQIPMITDLIASTEAELRSFQRHLDDVLKIAREDPHRTWERGEEIRLLCQAISAKKTALSKLWILRGETDKALDAMESSIDQMNALGHRIRARLEDHERPQAMHVHRSGSAKITDSRNNSIPQKRRLSRSARVGSAHTVESIYPLASGLRPRSVSASKRHEKCVARPVFEQFKARPNPFPP